MRCEKNDRNNRAVHFPQGRCSCLPALTLSRRAATAS
jgi:hypothetical protein